MISWTSGDGGYRGNGCNDANGQSGGGKLVGMLGRSRGSRWEWDDME